MMKQLSRKYIEIVMHLLVWGLVLSMPLFSFNSEQQHLTWHQYVRSITFPLGFAVIFYINYLFLIPKLFFTRRLLAFFAGNLLLYSSCTIVMEVTRDFHRPDFPEQIAFRKKLPDFIDSLGIRPIPAMGPSPGGPSKPGIVLRAFVAFAMTTGLAVAIRTTAQWFRSEEIRTDLEREHLKSELANLKNQLNPHFFFNTLNNIYSLINQNQERAQDAVHQLGKLMRYLLYESNEKYVSLNREIDFMHHYIDLMKLRITSNVTVTCKFPEEANNHIIAPLLFISLVENSFKHGISLNKPSAIDMVMEVTVSRELIFKIRNTAFPKADHDRSGSGIGLDNLRKRLILLYPHRHSLEVKSGIIYHETILTVLL